MTEQIELDRTEAPVKEPAKGWRNLWRSKSGKWNNANRCGICGLGAAHHARDPEIPALAFNCEVYPTKAAAELAAKSAWSIRADARVIYVGAFPVPTT